MARWQPDAPQRLAVAALELFEKQGYDDTTVIEIAQRAGLTKSTFFRHCLDKREVLFGDGALTALVVDGIAEAPSDATPFEAVAHAMDLLGTTIFTGDRLDFVVRRSAVIDASPRLREREALKGLAVTAAMADTLERRGVSLVAARVGAECGSLALELAFERWSEAGGVEPFGALARHALAEVQSAASLLCDDSRNTESP
ncbi:TetR/AcrR family transcriptional regulator [Gordonia sp. DT30]|uniref:TetR/AcrR family transcriptional regulator n=1 Tax=Gordonia sp. DT30 TaxID=3416546 RepID=UPI003CF41BDD